MRAYGSPDDLTQAADVPLSPSQSRSRLHACEPSVRRGLHAITPVPTKNDPLRGRRRSLRT
jgi:hypothetical protein